MGTLFTINTNLGKRKVDTVDDEKKPISKDVTNARFVDIDPMRVYVEPGDTIKFIANDHSLEICESMLDGDIFPSPIVLKPGQAHTVVIPNYQERKRIQLRFKVDNENPQAVANNEDPEIIVVPSPK